MEGLCKAMDVKKFKVHPVQMSIDVSDHRLGQPKFRLLADYEVSNLNYEGWDFTIPAGFKWNGANTILFGARFLIPSLVHDYIYSGLGDEKAICLTRKDADDLFLFYAKHCKIPKWVRYPAYWGMRIVASSNWEGREGSITATSPVMPINKKRYNVNCLTCKGRGWYGLTIGFGGDGIKRCNSCNPEND